ncbi:MAG: histidine kinase [Bacteroidales bacterium]|nr:histidine kinase [Bacteroidales bacterium]
MGNLYLKLLFCLLICSTELIGQQANNTNLDNNSSHNKLNVLTNKLLNSISSGEGNATISEDYYNVAMELWKTGDKSKAEQYLQKAIEFELKLKSSSKLLLYYRQLAKLQEELGKYEVAEKNYRFVSGNSDKKIEQQINYNDAERVKNRSNSKKELDYLNQNADLMQIAQDSVELVWNYQQMAQTNKSLNENDLAIENYNQALNMTNAMDNNSILIKSEVADLMAEKKEFEKAIEIQKEVVEQSKNIASVENQIQQIRKLSDLYMASSSDSEGLNLLREAYRISIEKGSIKEAITSILSLAGHFEKTKNSEEALSLYHDFVSRLEEVISKDSSLIDRNLFLINEMKISQLEKDQVLKDEMIERTSRNNFLLLGSVIVLVLMIFFIVKAWFSIKKSNKKIALQSLRLEMNPHFVFNSLNSVNQFIAENNELEANKYLTSYSRLMRNIMQNSNKDYVSLASELDQLVKYLELEKLRFPDKFDYMIEVDEKIEKESEQVPNMLIQPHLENAVWHGLRYRTTKGLLKLKIDKIGSKIQVTIEDNGIGLKESLNLKTENQKLHNSRGLKNVKERISLLNKIYGKKITMEVEDKNGEETGVKVSLTW